MRTSVNNETYEFVVIPRKKNSPYEYEKDKTFSFMGRPANTHEKKNYRIQTGVNGNADTVYIYATNLPEEVKIGDKVKFLGQTQTVESTGYYYDVNGIVNVGRFSEEHIIAKSPKGIALGK